MILLNIYAINNKAIVTVHHPICDVEYIATYNKVIVIVDHPICDTVEYICHI